ncbi:hypothetical protein KKR91_01220 [Arthrobacter jiangjiafuii]|uniref:Uncharacterized protein n=1 Tax=Arthrobacter jiangjiafuii TaxID=2817475 RepID=A0A975M5U4_9MICC|nr:hypothetical protein [Arthrobacter jiangjiafuii]MBP3044872.1 hypothetical protein [Arthrobacter jiangjiafuii]QWC10304.1 hypothetical protein KKR91_01220 [Arthrobacter jiangjiafuii]
MKTRHARLIRKGILAARDPELSQYVHLAPRLVREAARRETDNIEWREMRDRLTAWNHMPQRVVAGIDPAVINAEQAEHIRRFYA